MRSFSLRADKKQHVFIMMMATLALIKSMNYIPFPKVGKQSLLFAIVAQVGHKQFMQEYLIFCTFFTL